MENKILVIDLETTGFLPKGKIVEIGIVELDIITGEKRILFDKVVREQDLTREELELSWIILNGYMDIDEILASLAIEEVKEEVQALIHLYTNGATAFNNSFDFGFLESRGFKIPKKLPDPMHLSTHVCKLYGKRGIKNPTIQEAYNFFFGEYTEKHRGADDALHEADIVFELIKRGVFKI